MSLEENYSLMQKISRILAWVLTGLSLLCGLGYLALSTYFYLSGSPIHLWYFVLMGTLFSLTSIFALIMLFRKEHFFTEFAFIFTGIFAVAFDLALLLMVKDVALSSAARTTLLVLLSVNILAILSSFVLPVTRMFGKNGPMWALMISYIVEIGIWIAAIGLYGYTILRTYDWTFLLVCGITLLRSAQYEYFGPNEPLLR
jgi:hypothetical protein